jgi:hypothetical protein
VVMATFIASVAVRLSAHREASGDRDRRHPGKYRDRRTRIPRRNVARAVGDEVLGSMRFHHTHPLHPERGGQSYRGNASCSHPHKCPVVVALDEEPWMGEEPREAGSCQLQGE